MEYHHGRRLGVGSKDRREQQRVDGLRHRLEERGAYAPEPNKATQLGHCLVPRFGEVFGGMTLFGGVFAKDRW